MKESEIKRIISESFGKTVAGKLSPMFLSEGKKRFKLQQAQLKPHGTAFVQVRTRKTKIGKRDAERWVETIQVARRAKKVEKVYSIFFATSGFTKGALEIFSDQWIRWIHISG